MGKTPAKTPAQRQAEYRKARAFAGPDGNGDRRLNTWISTGASLALSRLANRYGVTRREILERLISEADEKISATLELDSPERAAYFDVTP